MICKWYPLLILLIKVGDLSINFKIIFQLNLFIVFNVVISYIL